MKTIDTTSHWTASTQLPTFPQLDHDITVDVAVVGAGLTGVTTAYLLKRAGLKVAVLERARCAQADTAHTTAHLTNVIDLRLHDLVHRFGREAARAVWDAGTAAMDKIFETLQAEGMDADFQWIPGYLYAADIEKDRGELKNEAAAAHKLGVLGHYVPTVPFFDVPGVKFANQALFHPLKFIGGLLAVIPGDGSAVFEESEVEEITDDPLTLKTAHGTVHCNRLVLATHNPLQGTTNLLKAALLQTKLSLYTSYALGAKIPAGLVPNAAYWDTGHPYSYLRVEHRGGHDFAIYGGEDHKTGQEAVDTTEIYRRLEERFRQHMPVMEIEHQWSGQVIETIDGLPYIGETADRQFVATGFGGNGMTFGVLGAMMAVDWTLGRKNPWADLFDPHRKKLLGGTWRYVVENKDYPYYLMRDMLGHGEGSSVENLERGHGRIVELDGRKVAAYRNEKGKVILRSPVCTHLQCIVHWNDAERTWDCPCHGSRFKPTGEVISGPAEKPLRPLTPPRRRAKRRHVKAAAF